METAEIKKATRAYLSKLFPVDQLRDDQDWFSLGLANSLFALQLVVFVENQFGIAVEDPDLSLENFNSIDAIARFVQSKTG